MANINRMIMIQISVIIDNIPGYDIARMQYLAMFGVAEGIRSYIRPCIIKMLTG